MLATMKRVNLGVTRIAPVLYTTSMPKNTPMVPSTACVMSAPALMPCTRTLPKTQEIAPRNNPSSAA